MLLSSVSRRLTRCARTWVVSAAVASIVAFGAPGIAGAQVAVVVHPSNTTEELSLDNLRRLFLGQAKTFPNGAHARLAVHGPSAENFDRAALGLQPQVVRSRWMAIVFRGEAMSIPTELPAADEVKKFVRDHPDAIAYLPLSQVDATVKVLSIAGHKPNDAAYVIR